jgi:hypothetical protein
MCSRCTTIAAGLLAAQTLRFLVNVPVSIVPFRLAAAICCATAAEATLDWGGLLKYSRYRACGLSGAAVLATCLA